MELVSDNATYFKRAAKEISEWHIPFGVCASSAWQSVQWKFNPPMAPHTGGIFESLIRSAKRALKAVLGSVSLWDDGLSSAFVFVEGLLNDRPLDFISTDASDMEPITPAHFLCGPRVQEAAFRDLDQGSEYSKRWRALNQIREQFWLRFLREIRPSMGLRSKWRRKLPPLVVGDVVVVLTEKNDAGRWPLGRITEVTCGRDGLVRVVKVKVKGKELIRHVNHLMPLL